MEAYRLMGLLAPIPRQFFKKNWIKNLKFLLKLFSKSLAEFEAAASCRKA